ncbi:hypothetical protein HELRODRAFT_172517 [Helobdella robusta]|uniref:Uncharacterized protein n=1 Tax=Helobdella robusta TaxID=6412 RepID=T1F5G1_HELRO|nr:hypothetical protein HELRODRAFT_172517 [Helobdella robusta]ESO04174.1 hypothetical protein HELRODRAFT_172517 [Helobdella robusta]
MSRLVDNCQFLAWNTDNLKNHMQTKHELGEKNSVQFARNMRAPTTPCSTTTPPDEPLRSEFHKCKTCGASYKCLYQLKRHLTKYPSHVTTTDSRFQGSKAPKTEFYK